MRRAREPTAGNQDDGDVPGDGYWEDIFQNRTEQQTAMWESTLLCFTRCRAGASGAGKG